MISNAVLKGGGVLVATEAGAIKALDDAGIRPGIKRIAGASAGTLIGVSVSLGLSGQQICDQIMSLDFEKFRDGGDPLRLVEHGKWGYFRNEFVPAWVESLLTTKLKPKATFQDLRTLGGPDLYTVATNLDTGKSEIFSAATSPMVIVSEAIKASTSIPFFYEAATISGRKALYVDGGMMKNYPIDIFDDLEPRRNTIGLYPTQLTLTAIDKVQYGNIIDYLLQNFNCLLDAQDEEVKSTDSILAQTALLDDFGMSYTNFSITQKEKQRLITSGYNGMMQKLKELKLV